MAVSAAAAVPALARRGAYGLRLRGVDAARELLLDAEADWPSFELVARVGHADPQVQWVRAEGALLRLASGGEVEIDRARGRALFTLPSLPTAAELVHPYLAPVAAVAARWLGRESFHAGAVSVDGEAWGVLGDKGAGKSSLLAALALAGHRLVADDVLVLDGQGGALAGPRSIDLRGQAAARLGVGRPLGLVGLRERWRLSAPPVASVTALRGFVTLAWGDGPAVASVPAAQRLTRLAAQRVLALPPADPGRLVELSALPMLELRRPRDWGAAAGAVELLLDALGRQA